MGLLRDGYVGRDPRRSRTARGVTALTRMSVAHVKLNRYPNLPARPRRWTTIDSPVAGKVVRQSRLSSSVTPTSRSGASDPPPTVRLPVDHNRSPDFSARTGGRSRPVKPARGLPELHKLWARVSLPDTRSVHDRMGVRGAIQDPPFPRVLNSAVRLIRVASKAAERAHPDSSADDPYQIRAQVRMKSGHSVWAKYREAGEVIDLVGLFSDYWGSNNHEFTMLSQSLSPTVRTDLIENDRGCCHWKA